MTRILVDLLFYTGTKGGMESYVRRIYSEMRAFIPGAEFVGLASTELTALGAPWFPGELINSGVSGENRMSWAWGELTAVGRAAERIGADVVHCPANLGPRRSTVPVVVTTHDMLPFRHPEYVPGPYAPVLRVLMKTVARRAARIVTISAASAADIARYVPTAANRIDVVPLAGSGGRPAAHLPGAHSNVLLALGNRLPHKNFDGLLRAIALIPTAERPHLVVTGSHSDDPLTTLVDELGLADSVTLKGWVDDAELEALYSSAAAALVPSFFEGFGLPVLDAMCRDLPVLCSDIAPLREVAGDAALYFDPRSPQSMADAITRALGNRALLASLRVAGRERAAQFSWTRTAELTAQSLLRAVR
ncbi:glycosyltransferase involved in cell wall biosynthesis [Glaciihabitans tibetensis]|uniref:Glycosyltransferase involved in cell wall biosynthesis n=1 Tax=Glaciihabitans tibetensis TaxID=1266600 RepID=A0A2T0VFE2_9MICO|nr:glycosyltransferase family 1 protein [Glaciihabitans tibetensis]PRY68911.1 glycosyltransferase involved in cell wall biosynthesis [Glaciihabitans tibetensis]